MMRAIVSITAVVIAVAGLTGCNRDAKGENVETSTAQDTIPVRVAVVEPRDFEVQGEYYGSISGLKDARIIATGGGRVDALYAKEGDRVKAGQHLGRINADEAVNAYETAKLNVEITKDDYERLQAHLEQGNASKVAVDQARLAWLNAKSALLQAERVRRGALCITPIDGVVMSRGVELYQELAPGTPTFTVSQTRTMKVTVGIPESDIANVKVGNPAEVYFDLYPDRTWKGELVRLSREVSARTRTFDAELQIPNKGRLLLAGLTARVLLTLNNLSDQIVVPTSVIGSEKRENYVMTVRDGKARYNMVELGASTEAQTVILSGVAQGDTIITGGQHLVSAGTPVKIVEKAGN